MMMVNNVTLLMMMMSAPRVSHAEGGHSPAAIPLGAILADRSNSTVDAFTVRYVHYMQTEVE